jgi:hypothetical protein
MKRVVLLAVVLVCLGTALAAAPPSLTAGAAIGAPPATALTSCPGPIIQRCDTYCARRGCFGVIGPPPSCVCSCYCG